MLIDPGTEFFELGLDAGYNIGKIKLYGGEIYESEKRGHIPGGGHGYRRRRYSGQGLHDLCQ